MSLSTSLLKTYESKKGKPQDKIKITTTKDPSTGNLITDKKQVAEIFAAYLDENQNRDEGNEDRTSEHKAREAKTPGISTFVVNERMLDEVMTTITATNTKDPYGMNNKTIKNVYPSIKKQMMTIGT